MGGRGYGLNKFDFSRHISEEFRFSSGNFTKNFNFPRNNWPFTATSGQIILFRFKSHRFRRYFLYMIRYNNISRPVQDPQRPPRLPHDSLPKIWGRDSQPPIIDAPDRPKGFSSAVTSSLSILSLYDIVLTFGLPRGGVVPTPKVFSMSHFLLLE